MQTEAADMPHNRVVSRFWSSNRYRPPYKNLLYGGLVFVAMYGLYYMWQRQDAASIFTEPWKSTDVDVSPEIWQQRAQSVKEAFKHAYDGYERYAAPSDELKPLTRRKIDNFNGWGLTIFDSLDTMLLLGLQDEFDRALPYVEQADFSVSKSTYAPYFETVIRYLGGLLSAYALSRNQMLLRRADELAAKLDPIFNTPSGFPFYEVNPSNGETRGPEIGILAEIASLQMEYSYLAKLTGKKDYFIRANMVIQTFANANLTETGGMFPIGWNITSGQPHDQRLSVGAQADSAHEYLLKQYLLTAKTDRASLEMYLRATTHIITNLLFLSPNRHLLYVSDTRTSTYDRKASASQVFEHLSCFLPGLLALGAHTLPLDKLSSLDIDLTALGDKRLFGNAADGYITLASHNLKNIHLWAAEGLAQTCWLTYADQPTGLGPDEVLIKSAPGQKFWDGTKWEQDNESYLWIDSVEKWRKSGGRGPVPGVGDKVPVVYSEKERLTGKGSGRDYVVRKSGYLLRPETIESIYLLWRVTGDAKWRMRGWAIFKAIERETKTPFGYASLLTVEKSPAPKDDNMPSYFLAETLKYLYLMFLEDDPIDLKKWVFNTEAHPFPVFEWTAEEKARFGI